MALAAAARKSVATQALAPLDTGETVDGLLSTGEFNFIRHLAMVHAGIALADYKRNMVYRRVSKRLKALGLQSVSEYCAILADPNNASEVQGLINALTTNKTDFFREGHHFEHMAKVALPSTLAALNQARSRRLRIWSAGCSSGQEPYSIAMTLRECMPDLAQWDARIMATDIDTDIIDRASKGIYGIDEVNSIPAEMRRKYVSSMIGSKGQYRISEDIQSKISFRPLNLHDVWPMRGMFDIIFCRNVVIYFDKPTQCRLFDRFANIMNANAYLYVGHSESLYKVSDRFRSIGQSIYQKIE